MSVLHLLGLATTPAPLPAEIRWFDVAPGLAAAAVPADAVGGRRERWGRIAALADACPSFLPSRPSTGSAEGLVARLVPLAPGLSRQLALVRGCCEVLVTVTAPARRAGAGGCGAGEGASRRRPSDPPCSVSTGRSWLRGRAASLGSTTEVVRSCAALAHAIVREAGLAEQRLALQTHLAPSPGADLAILVPRGSAAEVLSRIGHARGAASLPPDLAAMESGPWPCFAHAAAVADPPPPPSDAAASGGADRRSGSMPVPAPEAMAAHGDPTW